MFTVHCECGEKFHTEAEDYARFVQCRRCGRYVRLSREPDTNRVPEAPSDMGERKASAPASRPPRASSDFVILSLGLVVAFLFGRMSKGDSNGSSTAPPASAPSGAVETMPPTTPVSGMAAAPTRLHQPPRKPEVLTGSIEQAGAATPSCVPDDIRPANGSELVTGTRAEDNQFTVSNGTNYDAVVVLSRDGGDPSRVMYVRSGATAKALEIPSGSYRIQFALGLGFSNAKGGFCEDDGATEFDAAARFEQYPTANGVKYTEESITLHTVPGGRATSHRVPSSVVLSALTNSSPRPDER